MLFNWGQEENKLLKLYVDVAVPVAGKYTNCKLEQALKQDWKVIETDTVGMLVNFTHSSCLLLIKANWKLLQALREGKVIDLRLRQSQNVWLKEVHEFNVGGNITDLKLLHWKKAEVNDVIPVEFEGNVISNKLKQPLNTLWNEDIEELEVGITTLTNDTQLKNIESQPVQVTVAGNFTNCKVWNKDIVEVVCACELKLTGVAVCVEFP